MRLAIFLPLFFVASSALVQAQTDSGRGSVPPGLSQDGARPADGAITGGSIAPGERAGVPSDGQSDKNGAAAGGSASRLQRCYQLEGTLREQCLADEGVSREDAAPRAPSGGSTTPPATRRD